MASFTWPPQGGTASFTIGSPANGLTYSGGTLSLGLASTSTTGALSSTDWNTFNNKQSTLTLGNLTDAGTDGITITSGTGAVVGSGTSISQAKATSSQNGYLASTDWSTFNNKQAALTPGSITESTSSILTITNGSAVTVGPNMTIQVAKATTSTSGYLSNTDWNTFNGKQSTLTLGNLTEATSSVLTITGNTNAIIGSGLTIQVKQANTSQSGYLSNTDWNTFNGKGSGNGSVTSVTFTGDGTVLSSTPSSAVTTSGTVTASLNTQAKNTFLAGPTSGSNAAPTFRAMATADYVAPTIQTFTTVTSGTYTLPTSPRKPLYIRVRMAGGGGGGGGGTAGTAGAGETTTFGSSFLTCTGGAGGGAGGVGGQLNPVAGGTATIVGLTGIAVSGGQGSTAGIYATGTQAGISGGTNPFGGAGGGGLGAAGGAGAANTGAGGGGGGTTSSGTQAGQGGAAGGYINVMIPSPSSTYSYAVGGGGAAGTTGGQVYGAGAGGTGVIIVEEFYQ